MDTTSQPSITRSAPTVRAAARWLLAAALLVAGWVIPLPGNAPPVQAALQTTQQAGLVVSYGGGRVNTYCVDLGSDGQASGEEVLRAAGLPISADYGAGMGAGICKIQDTGCSFPAESCFCQCSLNPGEPCRYWGYSQLEGGDWSFSNLGASTTIVRAGDVEGWAWGNATISSPAQPPVIPYAEICLAPTATATATFTPQPTATWTPEPTATWTPEPTATEAPTETAIPTLPPPTETPAPSATASTAPSNTPVPSATNTAAPSATTASSATATRAASATTPPAASPTGTTIPVSATPPTPSATPSQQRATWTVIPASPTETEVAQGGAGEEASAPTAEPSPSATDIPTLTVTLPTATPIPTETASPTEAPTVEVVPPTPTLGAIAVAPIEPTAVTPTLVETAQEQRASATPYLIFAAMVVLLGTTLIVVRARRR